MPNPRDLTRPVEQPAMLFVEGMDEFALLVPLLEHMGVDCVDIRLYEGINHLLLRLRTLTIMSDFAKLKVLGVLRDAEESGASALQSVQDALKAVKLVCPNTVSEFEAGTPTVGVFIAPDGKNPGSLETMCWPSRRGLERAVENDATESGETEPVAASDVADCVTSYLDCLTGKQIRLHPNKDKVRVHAYLAAHKKPGLKIGEAAAAGRWDFDHSAWAPLRDFIETMNRLATQ